MPIKRKSIVSRIWADARTISMLSGERYEQKIIYYYDNDFLTEEDVQQIIKDQVKLTKWINGI